LSQEGLISRYHPEDVATSVYYRDVLEKNGIRVAPIDLAKQFSFEGEESNRYAWDGQFGFHGLKWTDISKWSKLHPEYRIDNPAIDKSKRDIYF
jgi:hypothetical protein